MGLNPVNGKWVLGPLYGFETLLDDFDYTYPDEGSENILTTLQGREDLYLRLTNTKSSDLSQTASRFLSYIELAEEFIAIEKMPASLLASLFLYAEGREAFQADAMGLLSAVRLKVDSSQEEFSEVSAHAGVIDWCLAYNIRILAETHPLESWFSALSKEVRSSKRKDRFLRAARNNPHEFWNETGNEKLREIRAIPLSTNVIPDNEIPRKKSITEIVFETYAKSMHKRKHSLDINKSLNALGRHLYFFEKARGELLTNEEIEKIVNAYCADLKIFKKLFYPKRKIPNKFHMAFIKTSTGDIAALMDWLDDQCEQLPNSPKISKSILYEVISSDDMKSKSQKCLSRWKAAYQLAFTHFPDTQDGRHIAQWIATHCLQASDIQEVVEEFVKQYQMIYQKAKALLPDSYVANDVAHTIAGRGLTVRDIDYYVKDRVEKWHDDQRRVPRTGRLARARAAANMRRSA